MNRIEADLEEYVGILYDEGAGDLPTGMIGPAKSVKEISGTAAEWISEGLEWNGKRKVVIAYRPNEVNRPLEIDVVLTAGPKVEDDEKPLIRTLKLVEA